MICWDRFLKCRSTIDRINYPYWRFLDALSHNRYKEIRHIGFCIERAFKITGVTEKDPAFYDRIQKFGLGSFGCVPLFLITRVGARVLCSIVYGLIGLPLPHNPHPRSWHPVDARTMNLALGFSKISHDP